MSNLDTPNKEEAELLSSVDQLLIEVVSPVVRIVVDGGDLTAAAAEGTRRVAEFILARDQQIALEARKSERIKARQFYAKRNPLYTREWIADLLGISRPTLNKWLNDPGMFTVDAIQKLVTLKQSQKEE